MNENLKEDIETKAETGNPVMTTTSSGGLMLALKGPITCTPERWHRKPVTVNL